MLLRVSLPSLIAADFVWSVQLLTDRPVSGAPASVHHLEHHVGLIQHQESFAPRQAVDTCAHSTWLCSLNYYRIVSCEDADVLDAHI